MAEIKFNPCPLCGEPVYSPISNADKDAFYRFFLDNGRASISVHCHMCKLDLTVFTQYYPAHLRNYDSLLEILAEKWNRLSTNR